MKTKVLTRKEMKLTKTVSYIVHFCQSTHECTAFRWTTLFEVTYWKRLVWSLETRLNEHVFRTWQVIRVFLFWRFPPQTPPLSWAWFSSVSIQARGLFLKPFRPAPKIPFFFYWELKTHSWQVGLPSPVTLRRNFWWGNHTCSSMGVMLLENATQFSTSFSQRWIYLVHALKSTQSLWRTQRPEKENQLWLEHHKINHFEPENLRFCHKGQVLRCRRRRARGGGVTSQRGWHFPGGWYIRVGSDISPRG